MSTNDKRILIVDDSVENLEMAQSALQRAGFSTLTAANLEELDQQQKSEFDLILMDVEMPELFGDDVASILRTKRGVKTPIYLYSAHDHSVLAKRADEAQIEGYICKQDGLGVLVSTVKRILLEEA